METGVAVWEESLQIPGQAARIEVEGSPHTLGWKGKRYRVGETESFVLKVVRGRHTLPLQDQYLCRHQQGEVFFRGGELVPERRERQDCMPKAGRPQALLLSVIPVGQA